MRERPILFSAPMVRSILEGRKTQTRRIVRPQPYFAPMREHWQWDGAHGHASWSGDRPQAAALLGLREHCPYGRPGDRLWVRETWAPAHPDYHTEAEGLRLGDRPVHPDGRWCWYRATDGEVESGDDEDNLVRWRPSIHMPRWASRITLEVTGVRVERLQEISDEDARAEGIKPVRLPMAGAFGTTVYAAEWPAPVSGDTARAAFRALWESINGAESWDANPWVWVVEFRRVEPC